MRHANDRSVRALHTRPVLNITYVESCAGDRALVIRWCCLGRVLGGLGLLSPGRSSLTLGEEVCG
jgi:hypothetical protein